jgi:ABC-2 type transport system permease protein
MTSVDRVALSARLAAARGPVRRSMGRGLTAHRTIAIFLRKDLAEGSRFRAPLLLDLGFGLINLASFLFISRLLHHPDVGALGGAATYFDFVAVGLACLLVVQSTCSQLISRVQEHQRSGTLEVLVATPVSPRLMAIGLGSYPTLLGVLRSIVYLAVAGVALGMNLQHTDWLGTAVMVILGSAAALAVGICLAAFTIAFAHGSAVGRTAVVGIGFLSGAYFPIFILPAPLQFLAAVLPTRMAIDGLRAAMAGGSWTSQALLLAGITVVGLPLSTWVFAHSLRSARRKGTLTRA